MRPETPSRSFCGLPAWLTATLFAILPLISFAQAPVISSAATADVEVGFPFQYQIETQLNNAQSYRTTTPLPSWLTLSPAGLISGVAPQSENGAGIIRQLIASNASGDGPQFQLTLTVIKRQRPAFATGSVPQRESRPGAAGILFIDFLTETQSLSGSYWNGGAPFSLHACGLSEAQMTTIYESVKEDFLPFNMNVTTKRAVYDSRNGSGAPYKRMRCIVTPTDRWLFHWNGIEGRGIGQYNTFRLAGTGSFEATVPMFVFVSDFDANGYITESPREIAGHISHEFGHALGLYHDQSTYTGASYFPGTGRYRSQGPQGIVTAGVTGRLNVWTPIMGLVSSGFLTQWSQGEYWGYKTELNGFGLPWQGTHDDVALIAGHQLGSAGNDIGFAADDAGDTLAEARLIPGSVSISTSGFIGRTPANGIDQDYFTFSMASPGTVDFLVAPAEPFGHADPLVAQNLNLGIANLFMAVELRNSSDVVLQTLAAGADGPTNGMPPSGDDGLRPSEFLRRRIAGYPLPAGTYYLRVAPAGLGNPNLSPEWDGATLVDVPRAFTSYGSMGAYSVVGAIHYTPVITSASTASGSIGLPFEFFVTANQPVTTYTALGLPAGLSIDNTTGRIAGVPTVSGEFPITISADNAGAAGTGSLTITIAASSAIATATDNALNWSTPNNQFGWFSQTNVTHDGVDAAQSGPIGHGQNAGMQVIVPGPGTISYWRKVDSEFDADFFIFTIDDIVMDQASGNENWVQKTFSVPAGSSKILRWSYRKDLSTNTGVDAAWVDQVVYTQVMPPVITSAGTLSAEQGTFISYPIIATNSPASYSIESGAVPGMSLNTSSGVFSGTPTVTGQFNITLGASNAAGTGVVGLVVTVTVSLADALDNTTQVFTRSGDGNWMGQQSISFIGGDSAQSADINDGQSCALQTTVAGPGNLSFWWKTDCEATNDYLICKDNGTEINGAGLGRISGNNNFTNVTYTVGSGSHTITWTYQKNGSVSVGADAGWVDGVAFGPALPVITSPSSLAGPVGYPLNYDIVATNSPTSYDQTGALPPGMLFSPTIHLITGFPNQAGVWTVSVSATNGAGTASQNVTLYIQGSRVGWNLANNLTGANALALADPDGDGLVNLMEMALARDPNLRDNGFQPVDLDPMTNRLRARFRFNRRLADVTYYVETSPDLVTWTPIFTGSNFSWVTTPGTTLVDTFVSDMTYDLEVIDATAAGGAPRKFMRMRFVEQ